MKHRILFVVYCLTIVGLHPATAFCAQKTSYQDLVALTRTLEEKYAAGGVDRVGLSKALGQGIRDLGFGDANTLRLHRDLAEAGKEDNVNLAAFRRRLKELSDQERSHFLSGRVDRQRIDRILRRSEFVLEEKPRIWDLILAKIDRLLRYFLGWFPGNDQLLAASRFVTILVLAGLVALLVYLIVRHTRGAPQQADLPAVLVLSEEYFLREPTYYSGLAEEAFRAGEFRLACRHSFYAILSALHNVKLISYEPSCTNWEYWRSLRSREQSPETVDRFQESIRGYERIWYGSRPADSQSAADFREDSKFFLGKFS